MGFSNKAIDLHGTKDAGYFIEHQPELEEDQPT